ncbi:MAG: YARHG domain-containing protein, partial [SAR324 cluster bacterium]|nr:YARHG domain-containing protein [SAR324 cluster bacterium]
KDGDAKRARTLLEQGADLNPDEIFPIQYALQRGNQEMVALFLENGQKINGIVPIDQASYGPLLHSAILSGQSDMVLFLLDQGANPKTLYWAADLSTPPLVLVVEKNKGEKALEILARLLAYGADIHQEEVFPAMDGAPGHRISLLDIGFGKPDVLKVILRHGINLDVDKMLRAARRQKKNQALTLLMDFKRSPEKYKSRRSGKRLAVETIGRGNLALMKKRIRRNQVAGLTKAELRIIRNTIFAQYGYRFKSKDLQAHFKRFSWYRPRKVNLGRALTATDKFNLGLLKKAEARADRSSPGSKQKARIRKKFKLAAITVIAGEKGTSMEGKLVVLHRVKGFKKTLSILGKDKIERTLPNSFARKTKIDGLRLQPLAVNRFSVAFTGIDGKYKVSYLWHLEKNVLYFKAFNIATKKVIFSKNLPKNSPFNLLLRDAAGTKKMNQALARVAELNAEVRKGNVPVFGDNIADVLKSVTITISLINSKQLVVNNHLCIGMGSWICKEYPVQFSWSAGEWNRVKSEQSDLVQGPVGELVQSLDLNGDGVDEIIFQSGNCFRNHCEVSLGLYTLDSAKRRYVASGIGARGDKIAGECSGTFTTPHILVDVDAKPFPIIKTVIRKFSQADCEEKKIGEVVTGIYQWDARRKIFMELN